MVGMNNVGRINTLNNSLLPTQKYMFGQPVKKKQAQSGESNSTGLLQKHELKKKIEELNNQQSIRNSMPGKSVLDSSMSYLDSLRETRNKNKSASLEKKKLRYSYKAISSKIIQSKHSSSAKEAVSKAKREVDRLKKLRSKGEYDSEELEAAIAHAQSMVRVAKKKEKHLEEEEMMKAAGGFCLGNVEEKEPDDEIDEEMDEEALDMDEVDSDSAEDSFEQSLSYEEQPELYLEAEAYSVEQMADYSEEMLAEVNAEMADLMEEMGLEDLLGDMGMEVYNDPDPADYKMMVIKHRSKEMKEMAEADGEYLKAIFDKMEKEKGGAASSAKVSGAEPAGSTVPSMGGVSAGISPVQIAGLPTLSAPSVSIDISV